MLGLLRDSMFARHDAHGPTTLVQHADNLVLRQFLGDAATATHPIGHPFRKRRQAFRGAIARAVEFAKAILAKRNAANGQL
jgi:hypothetical protein